MMPFFSVVIPTKNNEDIIARCLKSLKELDYPQDRLEIIIADGQSRDKTREIATQYGARVVIDKGNCVCSARNRAFEIAQGSYVAISDADCVMDKNWLKNSLKYFDDDKIGGIGGANLVPEDEIPFGKAVGIIFDYASYIVKAAHTRVLKKVIESRSHGSNAIYRIDVIKKVTPVDESLLVGEDIIMNNNIEKLGYKLLYVPDVIVYHYRRPNIRRWWRQMYAYGMGRVFLPRKVKGQVSLPHILVGLSVPVMVAVIITLAWVNPLWLVAGFMSYILLTVVVALLITKDGLVAMMFPIVLAVFFIAWSFGFIHELFVPTLDRGEIR